MSYWRVCLLVDGVDESKFGRSRVMNEGFGLTSRDAKIPCFKNLGPAKGCASCSSGACPFTLPPPVVPGPSPVISEVIGRLETLAITEGNPERRKLLEVCAADLRRSL